MIYDYVCIFNSVRLFSTNMFHCSRRRAVHLFSSLVPHIAASKTIPKLSADTLQTAKGVLEERAHIFKHVDLLTPLTALVSPLTVQQKQKTISQLSECVDSLRSQLYQKTYNNALDRLQIHEGIMAAGYYQRTISPTELTGEHLRFVLNHYNFDVRRDIAITRLLHDSLRKEKEVSAESEKLLRDILLLERRLFGHYRFAPTSGQRWLVLGLRLSDLDSEEELHRIMALPAVKEDGNFSVSEKDTERHWKTVKIAPLNEADSSFAEVSGVYTSTSVSEKDLIFELRTPKPVPPMEFWERVKDKLLRYWVIWFSLWVMFFMVDEEIITLVALIALKWKHTINLEKEAERTGGKVYMASSVGRSIS